MECTNKEGQKEAQNFEKIKKLCSGCHANFNLTNSISGCVQQNGRFC